MTFRISQLAPSLNCHGELQPWAVHQRVPRQHLLELTAIIPSAEPLVAYIVLPASTCEERSGSRTCLDLSMEVG